MFLSSSVASSTESAMVRTCVAIRETSRVTTRKAIGRAKWSVGAMALFLAASVVEVRAATTCDPAPPAKRDLDLPRFYSDDAGSVVDPDALAKHRAEVAPLTEFLRHVTSMADKAVRRGNNKSAVEAADCALAWLTAWARGDAWLGLMSTRQAEYQRKWDLAGAALAYLKVRRFATADQRAIIEPWLVRFADVCRAFFDDPERKRNNHWYWLGVGLGAVGLAADSPKHWDMARDIMRDAVRDIRPDGTLPHELEREGKALHYHVFSVTPLVAMAEMATAKGEDWYAMGDNALHRLIEVTDRGLSDLRVFETLTHHPQDPKTSAGSGWKGMYATRFPARAPKYNGVVAPGHRWLGGDALVLQQVLAAGVPGAPGR
jgi:poly(beta-D-mannuronate) lyase